MPQAARAPLTFERAMSVHVLRAQGLLFSELTRLFGANSARFHEIIVGNLFPGSWEAAVSRLIAGDIWHTEIAKVIEEVGLSAVIDSVGKADPRKKQFQRRLKRARKFAPVGTLTRAAQRR